MCMTITSVQLVVTSCGKVICSTCKPRLSTITCRQCQGPCTRTIPLTEKAPKEVLNLFTDISAQLKAVFKNYNFQESQKKSLLDFKERRSAQIKQMGMELVEKKKSEMLKLEQMREQLDSYERREAELKSNFNRITSKPPNSKVGYGSVRREDQLAQNAFGGILNVGPGVLGEEHHLLGQSNSKAYYHQADFLHQFGGGKGDNMQSFAGKGGLNRSSERLHRASPPQPGFLEMKTPAVWYHKQRDSMPRNNPQQKLMELGAVKRTDGGSRSGGSSFFTSPPARRH